MYFLLQSRTDHLIKTGQFVSTIRDKRLLWDQADQAGEVIVAGPTDSSSSALVYVTVDLRVADRDGPPVPVTWTVTLTRTCHRWRTGSWAMRWKLSSQASFHNSGDGVHFQSGHWGEELVGELVDICFFYCHKVCDDMYSGVVCSLRSPSACILATFGLLQVNLQLHVEDWTLSHVTCSLNNNDNKPPHFHIMKLAEWAAGIFLSRFCCFKASLSAGLE